MSSSFRGVIYNIWCTTWLQWLYFVEDAAAFGTKVIKLVTTRHAIVYETRCEVPISILIVHRNFSKGVLWATWTRMWCIESLCIVIVTIWEYRDSKKYAWHECYCSLFQLCATSLPNFGWMMSMVIILRQDLEIQWQMMTHDKDYVLSIILDPLGSDGC